MRLHIPVDLQKYYKLFTRELEEFAFYFVVVVVVVVLVFVRIAISQIKAF
jgi:hypothetical protein